MKNIKKTLFIFCISLFALVAAPSVLAQTPIEPSPPGGVLGVVVTWLLSATGIMLVAQALMSVRIGGRPLGQIIPPMLKPLIGPVFGIATSLISQYWGLMPDFSPIIGVFVGSGSSVLFGVAKGFGMVKTTG